MGQMNRKAEPMRFCQCLAKILSFCQCLAKEAAHGLDPFADDAFLDPDNDGISNLDEYENGLNPQVPDPWPGITLFFPEDGVIL